jgi:hypothetical protein
MSELTDKELVQLLSDMAEGDLAEGAEVVDHPAYIAAYRITQLRASPWISVEDRLPEEQGFYFSLDDCGRGNVDWFSGKDFENEYLTHWMPIPPTQAD